MVLQLLLSPATPRVLAEKCPSVLKSVFGNKRYHKAVCEHTLDRNRNCLSLSYQPHLPPRTSLALHVSCMGVSWALTQFCAIRTFGTRMTSPSSTNQKVKRHARKVHGRYPSTWCWVMNTHMSQLTRTPAVCVRVQNEWEFLPGCRRCNPPNLCHTGKWCQEDTWKAHSSAAATG